MADETADPLLDGDDETKLNRIADMDPMHYERLRDSIAKAMGVRVSALDQERARRRRPADATGLNLDDPEPWPETVDTGALLDTVVGELGRYMIMPGASRDAVALWVLLTYCRDTFFVLAMLAIQSPQKRCGKSTLLILLHKLASRALLVANLSPAALFRLVEKYSPTLLLDEADAWAKENEELRGLLNCGHTKETAHVVRVEGEALEPRVFNVFCPKALAGIGGLPDTIEDRSIIVPLKRRRPDESVEKLRLDRLNLTHVRRLAVRWAADSAAALRAADPAVPTELHDRAADNWRPLLAIADLAGGEWPAKARRAAIAFALADADEDSIGVLLLGDLRTIFDHVGDRITSDDLVDRLAHFEDRPWAEWGKARKPITKVQLARLLAPFDIKPNSIRLHGESKTRKGYHRDWFVDAFARYLKSAVSSGTPEQSTNGASFRPRANGTADVPVPDRNGTCKNTVPDQNAKNPSNGAGCSDVPDQNADLAAWGMVRCRDCMYYDADESVCLQFDKATERDTERSCRAFSLPF
jgi:putative DNA primase/helicase